jgi:hypothetical protein
MCLMCLAPSQDVCIAALNCSLTIALMPTLHDVSICDFLFATIVERRTFAGGFFLIITDSVYDVWTQIQSNPVK